MTSIYHGTTAEYHDQRIRETGSYSNPQRNFLIRFLFGERINRERTHIDDLYFTGSPFYALCRAIINAKKHNTKPAVLVTTLETIRGLGKVMGKDILPHEHTHTRLVRGNIPSNSYKIVRFDSVSEAEKVKQDVINKGNVDSIKLEGILMNR